MFCGFLLCQGVVDVGQKQGAEYRIWTTLLQGSWVVPIIRYRVTHQVVLKALLTSKLKFRFSIKSLYLIATLILMPTKLREQPDVSLCTCTFHIYFKIESHCKCSLYRMAHLVAENSLLTSN